MSNIIYFQKSWTRIIIFVLLFILGGSVSVVAGSALGKVFGYASKEGLMLSSVVQNLLMFAMPAICAPFFFCTKPMAQICADVRPRGNALLGVLIAFCIGIPALNQVIYWNQHISLPESMAAFEQQMRTLENQATQITEILMNGKSIGSLIAGILVIGILTGVCEELFFRGGLQRILTSNKVNHHAAIWTSAVIFSLLHFQMYGLVPRIFLGAFFGYLMWWTGSLWVSASAHALNNSVVVLANWLAQRGIVPNEDVAANIGVDEHGVSLVAVMCACAFAIFIFKFKSTFFTPTKDDGKKNGF